MDHAKEQAQAQYESIVEFVDRLRSGDDDEVMDEIYADALSVQLRSDWENRADKFQAGETEILLCTGGPAVRIRGELENGEPSSAKLQHQNWFTALFSLGQTGHEADEKILLTYTRCFYFGEYSQRLSAFCLLTGEHC